MVSFLNTREKKKVVSLPRIVIRNTTAKNLRRFSSNTPTRSLLGDKKTFTQATQSRARMELKRRGLKR